MFTKKLPLNFFEPLLFDDGNTDGALSLPFCPFCPTPMQYLNAVAHPQSPWLESATTTFHLGFAKTLVRPLNTIHVLEKHQVELHWDRNAVTFRLKTSTTTIGRGAGSSHATQLVLAGEFAAKLGKLSNKTLADLNEGIFGCDGAICLDADEELRDIRMGD